MVVIVEPTILVGIIAVPRVLDDRGMHASLAPLDMISIAALADFLGTGGITVLVLVIGSTIRMKRLSFN